MHIYVECLTEGVRSWLLNLPRVFKLIFVILCDLIILYSSVILSFYLRTEDLSFYSEPILLVVITGGLLQLLILYFNGLYSSVFRYIEFALKKLIWPSFFIYLFFCLSIFSFITINGVPRTVGVLQPFLLYFGMAVFRRGIRFTLESRVDDQVKSPLDKGFMVFGINNRSIEIYKSISADKGGFVYGFIDTSGRFIRDKINGVNVFTLADTLNLIRDNKIGAIYYDSISMDDISRRLLISHLATYPYARLIKYTFSEQAPADLSLQFDFSQINYLLGRDQTEIDVDFNKNQFSQKVLMVTGAGGSIGSEICRQLLEFAPATLILVEFNEFMLYEVYEELLAILNKKNCLTIRVVPILASAADEKMMRGQISSWSPDVIFHAAAYKHVPMVESNICPAVINNIKSTLVCAKLSLEYGVGRFILISSDKAVRPTNVMGVTKRVCELILQGLSNFNPELRNQTIFSMVRFGNVLGSSGSVLPVFLDQMKSCRTLSITDSEITRYFMSIPEAAKLVIQAGTQGVGGDVFLLDMGAPVKIIDFAKRLIILSELCLKDSMNPLGDISIQFTGLRPGEKLFEELLIGNNPKPTLHPKIIKAEELFIPWLDLENELNDLILDCEEYKVERVMARLKSLVPDYRPHTSIVDYLYLQNSLADSLPN